MLLTQHASHANRQPTPRCGQQPRVAASLILRMCAPMQVQGGAPWGAAGAGAAPPR
jgi:hypothetical protein